MKTFGDCLIRWTKRYTMLRHVVVGGTATVIHYAVYYVLIAVNLDYNIAYTVGVAVSLVFNFAASNRYTFNTRPTPGRGLRFLAAHAVNYLFCIGLLNLYIYWGVSEYVAPLLVLPIAVPVNYLLVRFSLTGRVGAPGRNKPDTR